MDAHSNCGGMFMEISEYDSIYVNLIPYFTKKLKMESKATNHRLTLQQLGL